jgi:hypothetical protein
MELVNTLGAACIIAPTCPEFDRFRGTVSRNWFISNKEPLPPFLIKKWENQAS